MKAMPCILYYFQSMEQVERVQGSNVSDCKESMAQACSNKELFTKVFRVSILLTDLLHCYHTTIVNRILHFSCFYIHGCCKLGNW